MFGNAMQVQPKGRNPKLRAMQIKVKRDALGIKPENIYTAAQALEKALVCEEAAKNETHFGNKAHYLENQRLWFELAELLEEEERVQASA